MHAARSEQRSSVCLAVALALHAALLFVRFREHPRPNDLLGLDMASLLDVQFEEQHDSNVPGGGSPEPDPNAGAKAASLQTVAPLQRAVEVARADLHKDAPTRSLADDDYHFPDEPSASPLTSENGEAEPFPELRPRPAMRTLLESGAAEAATDRSAALQEASMSRSKGFGAGANGGPGGPGKGDGDGLPRLRTHAGKPGESPFGGKSGSFRADVCFIPSGTKSLHQIKVCDSVHTFFDNSLNISPRSFTKGFPGVAERIEWFAIMYRGRFTVRTSGIHRFRLLADDGAILKIDNKLAVDNDGHHAVQSVERDVQLEAGVHDFSVWYFQGPRDWLALQLFVTPPSGAERLFGPTI